jgi:hypothetical protein
MKLAPYITAFSICLALPSTAATINWTTQYVPETASTNTDATWYSVLSTSGALVQAENSGGGAINIDFNNDSITDIPFAAGSFSFGNTFGGYYNSSASNNLINAGTWAGSGAGVLPLAVTIGLQYEVQLLIADARNLGSASVRAVSIDGGAAETFNYFAPTNPNWGFRLFTGTFTADSATQNISIEAFNSNLSSAGPQLNAFQLRDVTPIPEPGALALLGLGIAGLTRRRKF